MGRHLSRSSRGHYAGCHARGPPGDRLRLPAGRARGPDAARDGHPSAEHPTRIGEIVVAAPVESAAKAALHEAMRAAKVSRSELARRLGVDEKEVRRMLDPGYGSKLPRIAKAIEAVGQRMVVGVEPNGKAPLRRSVPIPPGA